MELQILWYFNVDPTPQQEKQHNISLSTTIVLLSPALTRRRQSPAAVLEPRVHFTTPRPIHMTLLPYRQFLLPDVPRIARRIVDSSGVVSVVGEPSAAGLAAAIVRKLSRSLSDEERALSLRVRVTGFVMPSSAVEDMSVSLATRMSAREGVSPMAPADKAAIEALPVVTLGGEQDSEISNCSICMEAMRSSSSKSSDKVVVRMPCSHIHHRDCLVKWLETTHSCPLCRFPLPTSSFVINNS